MCSRPIVEVPVPDIGVSLFLMRKKFALDVAFPEEDESKNLNEMIQSKEKMNRYIIRYLANLLKEKLEIQL